MTIKEKVLASCKTSFAKYGLKKDELSKLVDQIIANRGLTDESQDEDVAKAITAVEPFVSMMQSAFNRAVTETESKYKGYVKPEEKTIPPIVPPAEDKVTPESIAKMFAEIKEQQQKTIAEAVNAAIAPYKEREEKGRLNALFNSNAKIKDIPEQFRSMYQLDKEENLDSMVQKCADDWVSLKQTMVSSGQFVEAPTTPTPETETNDFIKKMEEYAKNNAPSS